MKRVLTTTASALLIGCICAPAALAEQKVQANDIVELFEKLNGKQPGHRKVHARGLCATGTFTPNTAKAFSSAALLSNGELPVTVRFSVGSGNPKADERAPGTRGMGMKIMLPDGGLHMFTGNNFPVFGGKDPETFYGFLKTLLPNESGQPDMAKMMAYIKANPSVQAHAAWQQSAKTPASYANTGFFGLHTFYFDPAEGERVKFRWELVPDLGVKSLSKEEAGKMPAEFLADTMAAQLKSTGVSYSLQVSIGQPEDTDVDPSTQWPADRTKVTLGKVKLNSAGGDACTPDNFDPNLVSKGFSPSADPILRMRSPAYAISFGKRLSGQ